MAVGAVLVVAVGLALVAGLAACSGPEPSPTPIPTPSPTATPTPTPSPTPTPTASPSPLPATTGTYLAFGDSLAVGVGATRPDATGYVARLHRELSEPGAAIRTTALRTLAIGGETSTSMIAGGQLAAAVDAIAGADPPVALATLDIGGNDLLRLLGTQACDADPLGAECLQLLAVTLAEFDANFQRILNELRNALDEDAPDADARTRPWR